MRADLTLRLFLFFNERLQIYEQLSSQGLTRTTLLHSLWFKIRLTGTPFVLTHTARPEQKIEGHFTFKASDSVTDSRPAVVSIAFDRATT
ncbi:hypothetical protein CMK14_09980 [Candidatus Poribacteria bacterium]|nr:hypothetical protein [Candidatus Poribacteria bacterium]